MKIGVIADTHNKIEITRLAVARLKERGARALFHCGDLMNEEILNVCTELKPCYFVVGNNDPSLKKLKALSAELDIHCLGLGGTVEIEGYKIAVTHGHEKTVVKKLLAENPDFLLVGHSHVRRDVLQGVTRIINPGALHRSKSKSCALIDLQTKSVETVLME